MYFPGEMIRRLTFENFFSFRGRGELNLCTGARTPTDDSFVRSRLGDQISVLCGVFGANASGKTNALKALAFLDFFLRASYRSQKPEEPIPVDGFFGAPQREIRFSLEFEGLSGIYRYEAVLTPQAVLEERLSLRHEKTMSFRTLLLRKSGKRGPRLSQPSGFTDLAALRGLLRDRPNASMLAAGMVTGRSEFRRIHEALGRFETNVVRAGKEEVPQSGRAFDLIECARYFEENPHFMSDVEDRLKKADLGISRFFIKPVEAVLGESGETKRIPLPFVAHRTDSGEFEIPLTHESSGPKRLFALLRAFLPVLTDGGAAVIDEMESDLHPHLIPLLLDLFVDRNTNPKRAQLIFTCHHVEILNHLAKEQIFLVHKDASNASHIRRLSGIKGVRREENFFANYNAGRYEAVPNPELF